MSTVKKRKKSQKSKNQLFIQRSLATAGKSGSQKVQNRQVRKSERRSENLSVGVRGVEVSRQGAGFGVEKGRGV